VPTFKRSWIDQFIDWVETLPVPAWLFYLTLHLVFFLVINMAQWNAGQLTVGQFELANILDPLWASIPLVFLHSASNLAGPAIDMFREMINTSNAEFDQIKYEFLNLPAQIMWVIFGIFSVLLTTITIIDPQGFTGFTNAFSVIAFLVLGILGFSLTFTFIVHTYRRVILVNHIYQRLGTLNLFDLGPIFSLSGLTTRSAIGIVLIANQDFISNVITTSSEQDFALAIANTLTIFVIGSAAILIPLLGIHRKLQAEKNRLKQDNAKRIHKANDVLNQRMDQSEFENISGFSSGLEALFLFRDRINKIPTWPWDWAAIRGFISAVFLPLAIWAIQSLLTRFL
jgi:hypothetical protein